VAKFTKIDPKQIRKLRRFKIDYTKVRNLDYRDPQERIPGAFDAHLLEFPTAPFQARSVSRPQFPDDLRYLQDYSRQHFPKGKVLVLVNWELYPQIEDSISRYVMDLAYEGYYAIVEQVSGGTPQELQDFIKAAQPTVGCLLVGKLPVAWYELDNDFGDSGYVDFPCDLYYMDLSGVWGESDANGKFDSHTGDVRPDIWVGRLTTTTEGGNAAELLNDYFKRNHRFRTGRLGFAGQGIAFVDDDWQDFDDCALDYVFPKKYVKTFTQPATTNAENYKQNVDQLAGWVQLCAHSSPYVHAFKVPGAPDQFVRNSYLRDKNPPNAFFYNLFCCSNARFTEPDYMAGWYIFDKPERGRCNGMAAIGSTKSGSMLFFENLYGPMGRGKAVGEAYKAWWRALGVVHENWKRSWFYGLTLLGDPTLQWWSGAVPLLSRPGKGKVFREPLGQVTFRWHKWTTVKDVMYTIEIDSFGAFSPGKWAADVGRQWLVRSGLRTTTYEHDLTGVERGRWRVRATMDSLDYPWSPWRCFEYRS
jgi:hypothetical protein